MKESIESTSKTKKNKNISSSTLHTNDVVEENNNNTLGNSNNYGDCEKRKKKKHKGDVSLNLPMENKHHLADSFEPTPKKKKRNDNSSAVAIVKSETILEKINDNTVGTINNCGDSDKPKKKKKKKNNATEDILLANDYRLNNNCSESTPIKKLKRDISSLSPIKLSTDEKETENSNKRVKKKKKRKSNVSLNLLPENDYDDDDDERLVQTKMNKTTESSLEKECLYNESFKLTAVKKPQENIISDSLEVITNDNNTQSYATKKMKRKRMSNSTCSDSNKSSIRKKSKKHRKVLSDMKIIADDIKSLQHSLIIDDDANEQCVFESETIDADDAIDQELVFDISENRALLDSINPNNPTIATENEMELKDLKQSLIKYVISSMPSLNDNPYFEIILSHLSKYINRSMNSKCKTITPSNLALLKYVGKRILEKILIKFDNYKVLNLKL